jgi:hypothetical protein
MSNTERLPVISSPRRIAVDEVLARPESWDGMPVRAGMAPDGETILEGALRFTHGALLIGGQRYGCQQIAWLEALDH